VDATQPIFLDLWDSNSKRQLIISRSTEEYKTKNKRNVGQFSLLLCSENTLTYQRGQPCKFIMHITSLQIHDV
jgi:hypothetical protein